jgi:uncharacterized protein (DUF2461 family)
MTKRTAEMVHEHHTHIRTPEGLAYVPRTYAEQNADGMWEAWLQFHPTEGHGPALRTDRETSQSTREAVASWAAGLERAYFEGAFARAHPGR